MTAPSPEVVRRAAEARAATTEPPTPAEKAMLLAVGFGAAAQSTSATGIEQYRAGKFTAAQSVRWLVNVILRQIAKAMLGGEFFSQAEWQHAPQPKIITSAEVDRLTRAVETIISSEPQDQAEGEPDSLTMRVRRLAGAEVIRSGREGYAAASAQAIGDDVDRFIWRFQVDSDPCPKCVVLATQKFDTWEQAPAQGGHPGCACLILPEYRHPEEYR